MESTYFQKAFLFQHFLIENESVFFSFNNSLVWQEKFKQEAGSILIYPPSLPHHVSEKFFRQYKAMNCYTEMSLDPAVFGTCAREAYGKHVL